MGGELRVTWFVIGKQISNFLPRVGGSALSVGEGGSRVCNLITSVCRRSPGAFK